MKKYLKGFLVIILMIFSFYYTEKIALYVQNNTPLKKEIITYKDNNKIEFVNAEVSGNYIIPGINGLSVNVDKSYNKMKSYNAFSEKYLIYDEVKPEISVLDFKGKIINKGNAQRNAVSFIVNKDNQTVNYFFQNNISFDYISSNNYCIKITDDNCLSSNKQIVEPTITLNNLNFLKELGNISKGYIVYIESDLNQSYLLALINYIEYKGLKIYKLDDHLSENYSI